MNKNFLSTRSKVSAGFTLIELVIVMAIVGIMASVIMASLTDGRTKKSVETNAHEFASALREAQNYALSGKQIGGNDVCKFSLGWIDGSTYSLGYIPGGCAAASPTSIVNYSLKNGVTLNNFGTIYFSVPFGVVSPSSTLQVIFTKSSFTYFVCIYGNGKILETADSSCP